MYMYSLPQEIEVWYLIPAVRRELSKFLTKTYGFSYEKAGKALGISKAAISQYQKNKRASKIRLHNRVYLQVEKAARRIANNKGETPREILRILRYMKDKKLPFEFCKGGVHKHEECQEVMITYEKYWD